MKGVIVLGLLEAVIENFNEIGFVHEIRCVHSGSEKCIFEVTFGS